MQLGLSRVDQCEERTGVTEGHRLIPWRRNFSATPMPQSSTRGERLVGGRIAARFSASYFVESRNEGGLRASVTQDREAHPPPGQLRSVPNDFFPGSLKRFQFQRFYPRPCFLEFKRLVGFCQSENDRQPIEDAMTNFLDTRIGETRTPKAHSSGDLAAGADHHRVAVGGNQ
jgi:hypothetical protein